MTKKADQVASKTDQAKNLAQAVASWTGGCHDIKQVQSGKSTDGYYSKHAETLSCAELNFPEYTERGTFYRGLSNISLDSLKGLSKDRKTFLSNCCQCSSRSESKAESSFAYLGLILVFKNCLALDAKKILVENGKTYNYGPEQEMIIPAYQLFEVVSIVGKYITLEESD